ncbi:MAG: VWA domain-containing protein, partial [Planctomycetes bacterium]|nr:VWA domain-containing protein [Planctomycetota bacterium]
MYHDRKRFSHLMTITLSVLIGTTCATAQHVIIEPPVPMPPHRPLPPHRPRVPQHTLAVKQQLFTTEVTDRVAVTKIDQTFHNPYPNRIEGVYLFPLLGDASVSGFSMFVDGREIKGELLDRDEARRTYEGIVAKMRDPALLEYVGSRLYKARIFPIPANGDVRVTLQYTQTLPFDGGMATITLPLRGDAHSPEPAGATSVVVNIRSQVPIKNVFSPTHAVSVHRTDYQASVSYESEGKRQDRDFTLHYTLSDKDFGLAMLTYRDGTEDGFFMARIAPKAKIDADQIEPKDICFVIDTSGSMSGQKILQARNALKYCLTHLNSADRFNIVPFSHEPRPFAPHLQPASESNVRDAVAFVEKITAEGGTNINDALLTALKSSPATDTTRPYMVVFLTDGLPTIGETQTDKIINNVAQANSTRVRLFVFGVGHDVNTNLLDRLAEGNRGARRYVQPNESIEVKLSNFYRQIADPVLADLELIWGGLEVYDLFPRQLPDLFSGAEVVLLGRFRNHGPKAIELKGTRRGATERFVYEYNFLQRETDHGFLPRLWAIRKVGYLLDEIRLHGRNPELKESVVKLAKRYGIVTPYTSFLVTEEAKLAQRAGRDRTAADTFHLHPQRPAVQIEQAGGRARGKKAVDASVSFQRMRSVVMSYGFGIAA